MRILFLAALGIAVYWKFDSVVSSQTFRNLLKPSSLIQSLFGKNEPAESHPAATIAAMAGNWRWSRDSIYLETTCESPRYRDCLESWKGRPGPGLGELSAVIGKASAQWNMEPAGGFTARFRRSAGSMEGASGKTGLELSRLDMVTPKGMVSLNRSPEGRAFCAGGECLDEIHPRPPFSGLLRTSTPAHTDGHERQPIEAVLTPLQSPVFSAVLDGRIVDARLSADTSDPAAAPALDSAGAIPPDNWVKVYHGRNLFSRYSGFARLQAGLRPGSKVRAGDTLGYVASAGDSLGPLGIRMIKDGVAMDPFAFLGLEPDSSEAAQ